MVTATRRQDASGPARGRAGGFTLVEVLVVVLIMSLIVTIGVKGFRSVAKSNLRENAAHLSGAIRYLFDRASITGKYYRLVIDLNDGKYWPEVSDDKFYVSVEAEDPKFDTTKTRTLLESAHPAAIELVHDEDEEEES